MEACEKSRPEYMTYDCAFLDKHIPKSSWRLEQTIDHLKTMGVKRVIIASGESLEELQNDPSCKAAHGFCAPLKIPPDSSMFNQLIQAEK